MGETEKPNGEGTQTTQSSLTLEEKGRLETAAKEMQERADTLPGQTPDTSKKDTQADLGEGTRSSSLQGKLPDPNDPRIELFKQLFDGGRLGLQRKWQEAADKFFECAMGYATLYLGAHGVYNPKLDLVFAGAGVAGGVFCSIMKEQEEKAKNAQARPAKPDPTSEGTSSGGDRDRRDRKVNR